MPTLFGHWGPVLAALAGVAWFGLLFFAGITSSLAMGQPVMAFLQDHFKMGRNRAAWAFGGVTFLLALPCVFLYERGAFGEFDYWAGTFSLVLFALVESILFSWVFGIDKGWEEINRGADIRIPNLFKFVIKYVTPLFLLAVFVGSMIKPAGGEWSLAFASLLSGTGWPLSPDSVIGTIFNIGVADTRWFVDAEPTTVLVIDATRILLCVVFIGIVLMVRRAWNIKERIA